MAMEEVTITRIEIEDTSDFEFVSVSDKFDTDSEPFVSCSITTSPTLSCDQCDLSFSSPDLLDIHVKTKHNETFVCSVCHRIFFNVDNLNSHVKWSHRQVTSENRSELPNETKVPKSNHPCRYCTEVFESVSSFYLHQRLVHEIGTPHNCDKCELRFYSLPSLNEHRVRHSYEPLVRKTLERKTHDCKFPTVVSVTRHVRREHELCRCSKCPQRFRTLEECNQHILSTHRAAAPQAPAQLAAVRRRYLTLTCPTCRMTFNNQIRFVRHMCGPQPTVQLDPCDFCGATYSSYSELSKHKAMHRKLTHSCATCCQIFSTEKQASKCEQSHRPQACEEERRSPRRHVPEHPCKTCGKLFVWKKGAKSCQRRHREKEPKPMRKGCKYQCLKCYKSFRGSETLEMHLSTCKQVKKK